MVVQEVRANCWRATLLLAATLLSVPVAAAVAEAPTRTVVDEVGRVLHVPMRIERVISLAPNLTEMVYALGLESRLVGVTSLCDFPPAAQAKPKVGDVLNPSVERIIELKADVVLGTTAGNRREIVESLDRAGVPLYGFDPRSVEDIFVSIRNLAELLGEPQAGKLLSGRLQAQLNALSNRLAGRDRPRVLFAIWLDPLLTVGGDTFLHDVLQRAGAESITAGLWQDWPRLSLEAVVERNPDYVVLPRTDSLEPRLARLAQRPPWQEVRAIELKHIVWLDEAVLRPGPRIVAAIEELARALHPEAFPQEAAKK